jgi:hypothetical protein
MKEQRKITLFVPEELLEKAQKSTKKGITETVRKGLELVAASQAYEDLRKMRGKVKFSIDVSRLREDR